MPAKLKTHTCEFVSATDLVPGTWRGWFWELISENAPFSWGDNNRSLVTASFFRQHCEERLPEGPATARFLGKLRRLGETYIDLES